MQLTVLLLPTSMIMRIITLMKKFWMGGTVVSSVVTKIGGSTGTVQNVW